MNTPIYDFIKEYNESQISRLHMPGHKGKSYLGIEAMDITEIKGADELYYPETIIAQSEQNATKLFNTGVTCYSTEGSSHCVRSMISLAKQLFAKEDHPFILAARNVHKAFIYALAIADIDVEWIIRDTYENSIASGIIEPEELENALKSLDRKPMAVYVTSPNYLGAMTDIRAIAEICHKQGIALLVDNAHGAYLRFLERSMHPIDLGADMCCDSAHKTLPVLTGGAYLHIRKGLTDRQTVKEAMEITGSTSPSYLILASLDLCNRYLAEGYSEKLKRVIEEQDRELEFTEPMKITIDAGRLGFTGVELGEILRKYKVEPEFCDVDYVVLMTSPETTSQDYSRIKEALCFARAMNREARKKQSFRISKPIKRMSIKEAVLAKHEIVPLKEAVGRVCGNTTVSCPPAIPIAVSGELITEELSKLFEVYNINQVSVVK